MRDLRLTGGKECLVERLGDAEVYGPEPKVGQVEILGSENRDHVAELAEQRVEKSVHLETKTIRQPNGSTSTIELYARGGSVGIGRLLDTGDLEFVPLRRSRTHRNGTTRRFRWYNDYRLPTWAGAGTVTVRLHGNTGDDKRGFNRTENVRPIAADDPASVSVSTSLS